MTHLAWHGDGSSDRPAIVVLSANTFCGRDFVDLLLERDGYRVIGISRTSEQSSLIPKYRSTFDSARYQHHTFDLNRDTSAIIDLLDSERPAAVVNFASLSDCVSTADGSEHRSLTNVVALAELVNHVRQQDYLRRFLQVSSSEVYDASVDRIDEHTPIDPGTLRGVAIGAADLMLATYKKQFHFPVLTVRTTEVYGVQQPQFRSIPRSIIDLLSGKRVKLYDGGNGLKSYLHIRDVSQGELDVLERGQIGQQYLMSPDVRVSAKEVIALVCRELKINFESATELVDELISPEDAAPEIDSTRIRSELRWRPKTSLEEGIAEVVSWIKQNWNEIRQ